MSTGQVKFIAKSKRLVGTSDFADRIIGYLDDRMDQITRYAYSAPATFGQIDMDGDGANSFALEFSQNPNGALTDGVGHLIDAANSEVNSGVIFENSNGTPYYVGIKYCSIPSGVRTNPRTGYQEYIGMKDEMGLSGPPSEIIDNGNDTYTFELDDHLLSASDDYTGRTVRLWKNNIATGAVDEADAIVDVVMDSPNSFTTAEKLGQTTVSLVEGDYTIAILGPVVTVSSTAMDAESYTKIGTITGNAGTPTSFNLADQNVINSTSWFDIVVNGVGAHWIPATDATYDLGLDSKRWRNVKATGLITGARLQLSGTVNCPLVPYYDDVHDIGSLSFKWKDVYCNGLYVEDNASGVGVLNHLTPGTANAYDLGGATYRYRSTHTRDLYIYGDGSGGSGLKTNLIPDGNATRDLGTTSYKYNHIHTNWVHANYLQLGTTAGTGVTTHLIPYVASTYSLGNASYPWNAIIVDVAAINTGVSTHLRPTGNEVGDLGSGSNRWRTFYGKTINLTGTGANGGGVASGLVPTTTGVYTLGTSSYRWSTLNSDKINIASTAGDGCNSNFNPAADQAYTLGSATYRWNELNVIDITVDHINFTGPGSPGIGGFTGNLIPNGPTGTQYIGSSLFYLGNIYCNNLYYKTSFSTFDNLNDLELIESYEPTGEYIEKEKDGQIRKVQVAAAETIPWPIIGDINENGEIFLDPADTTCFLLGAIKQLYQLHKKTTGELKTELDRLVEVIESHNIGGVDA